MSQFENCSHCGFPLLGRVSDLRHYGTHTAHRESECLRLLHAEIERLTGELKKANEQSEHFERMWYLAKDDAERYAFIKTLEGQTVAVTTFMVRGAAELDRALDDAMGDDAFADQSAQQKESGFAP